MPKTFDDHYTLLNRLEEAEQKIGMKKGAMYWAFDILSNKLGSRSCTGEVFTALFVETTYELEQRAEGELNHGQVPYSNHYYELSVCKRFLIMHAQEFIIAIFGDRNDPECIKAVKMTKEMINHS